MAHAEKNITVLYIITKLELGGAQKVCLALSNRTKSPSSIQTILISGTEGPLVAQAQSSAHFTPCANLTREFSLAGLLHEIRAFYALTTLIKQLKAKHPYLIIHTHSTKAGLMGRWAALLAGVKTRIHTIHGYAFHAHQSRLGWLVVYTLELITSLITTHFICVSKTDIQTGAHLFPRFSKKCSLIRAAVSDHWFSPLTHSKTFYSEHTLSEYPEYKKTPFIFGTVSCFKPQKNIIDLIEAFALVHQKHPTARLEIVGDGVLREKLESKIQERRIRGAVILHGWQHDIKPLLQTWHAFVLSSLWEGLPCAIIEARLSKLPVVAYDTGGITEVIKHGVNGLIYPQKEWRKLADGMMLLMRDPALYTQLQQYPDNLQEFTETHMRSKHYALYQKLLPEDIAKINSKN